jgi:hypothetical protein
MERVYVNLPLLPKISHTVYCSHQSNARATQNQPASPLSLATAALAATATELLSLHVRLLQLAVQHQHSYSSWQNVANFMLGKAFGLVSRIPKDSQLWSDFLHPSGGALEYCYVSYWQFQPSGRPYSDDCWYGSTVIEIN